MKQDLKTRRSKIKTFFAALGPGLVTGAADDDPSGIVTYSQAGAKFGYGQLWTALFMLPLMIAIQEICARIGLVTGKGIARVLKENYSRSTLYILVFLLLLANTINLGADIGAMAAVSKLFVDLPFIFFALIFFFVILGLEIFVPYHKYAKILKWLTISLLAYFLTGLIAAKDWHEVLRATFLPNLQFKADFFFIIVGVLGTTISPYMFFWQASQEMEEIEDKYFHAHHLPHHQLNLPKVGKRYIASMRLDTFSGMFFSELATWFIIVTTAAVLYKNGVTDIDSAAQAAQALEPLVHTFPYSGKIAEFLFALGIIGTGLLAIPIFAASSSYAIAEIFNFREGLANKFSQAKGFYSVIIIGTLIGLLINFIGINPITALIYTAVINGVIAVPIIFMLIRIGNNKKIMGARSSGVVSNIFAWITLLGMAASALYMFYSFLHK